MKLMKRAVRYTLFSMLFVVGVAIAQPLSQQVLMLLDRVNVWTALQTFGDVTITGVCTGCGGAGGGTVTSVAMTVAPLSVFDIGGTPIVGAGTLALTMDTQADNIVFAGPNGGGPLAPGFRALVDADVPDILTLTGSTVTWSQLDFTASTFADILTTSAADIDSGKLALARITTGGTVGQALLAGAVDPVYGALDLSVATSVTGQLVAASFPILTGDITTGGGTLVTDLSSTGVAPAIYGSATLIPQITFDDEGRATLAANIAIGSNNLLDNSRHTDSAANAATRGSVITGGATNLWDELVIGAAGTMLRSDGTDALWSTVGTALTALDGANVTVNTVALLNGGTNGALVASLGAVVYSTATAHAHTAVGVAAQCLLSNGAAAPTWGACATLAAHNLLSATHGDTVAASPVRGDILVGNVTPAWDKLTIGPLGAFLQSDGSDPLWSTAGDTLTSLNASSLSVGIVPTARLPTIGVANGGTGIVTYVVGDLLSANTTTTLNAITAVAANQVLTSAGVGAEAAWSGTPSLAEVNLTTELNMGGVALAMEAAPTVSACGTAPSISAENGTAAFRVTVGTATPSSCLIGLPTAANGWNCFVTNRTGRLANVAEEHVFQIGDSTTSATLENQTNSTGAAAVMGNNDVLSVSCFAF